MHVYLAFQDRHFRREKSGLSPLDVKVFYSLRVKSGGYDVFEQLFLFTRLEI